MLTPKQNKRYQEKASLLSQDCQTLNTETLDSDLIIESPNYSTAPQTYRNDKPHTIDHPSYYQKKIDELTHNNQTLT